MHGQSGRIRRRAAEARVASLPCIAGLFLLSWLTLSPTTATAEIDGFTRGDCNSDGFWDISDAISELVWLLAGGPAPACSDACDINDDGVLDIADGIFSLASLFGAGAPPPAPYPECGLDFTSDPLFCEFPPCPVENFGGIRAFTAPTGRIGLPYLADLPAAAVTEVVTTASPPQVVVPGVAFTGWAAPAGAVLPAGIELDAGAGVLFGSPTEAGFHSFSLVAEDSSSRLHLVRVDLAVFSSDESERVPGQDFTLPGPYQVDVIADFFIYGHELPWPPPYPLWACSPIPPGTELVSQGKQVRIYRPVAPSQPAPVLLFHHGTGFNHIQYDDLLTHLASHGFLCASINDPYSYNAYPVNYCWGGHDEGARVLLALRERIVEIATDPASPLFGDIDLECFFYGGHSRGAASAIAASEFDPAVRGVIALQPTDAKGDSFIGNTDRWDRLPGVPLLDISAEQDFDVSFPWAERLLERFTGASTMVTIYGGCHGYTTDDSDNGCLLCTWAPIAPDVDQCRYISRELQLRLTRQLMVTFLRRHGFGDLSVDGQLYGPEHIGSPYFSLASRRDLAGTTWIDDFAQYPLNQLGETWQTNGPGTAGIASCYDAPVPVPTPIVPIANLVLELDPNTTFSLETPLAPPGGALDVAGHRDVVFRLKNHDRWQLLDNFGFGWLSATLELRDLDGDLVAMPLDDRLPTIATHPEPLANLPSLLLKYQRYIDVRVPLADYLAANPALDLDELTSLRFTFTVTPTPELNTPPTLGLDDLRFE